MELRQLEFFVTSVEEKSFYKASAKLYTSQPAISKSMKILEKELNQKLLIRTSRGLQLTAHGERFYHYAKNILRQVEMSKTIMIDNHEQCLNFSSYPSKLISTAISEFYSKLQFTLRLEYQEGSVQDIIDFVSKGISEFGILYISRAQEDAFKHILSHKFLEFVPMAESELCIYAGQKSKLFNETEGVSIQELSQLKYIRGVRDFFSVEHHFDHVSLNEIDTAYFKDIVLTNSDHLVIEMLKRTDLCYMGIHFDKSPNPISINSAHKEKSVVLGYIKNQDRILTPLATDFLAYLAAYIT